MNRADCISAHIQHVLEGAGHWMHTMVIALGTNCTHRYGHNLRQWGVGHSMRVLAAYQKTHRRKNENAVHAVHMCKFNMYCTFEIHTLRVQV